MTTRCRFWTDLVPRCGPPLFVFSSTPFMPDSLLPHITPELLWFESFTTGAPERALTLPNGDVAFCHRDAVMAMPPDEWQQFQAYQQAAA